MVYINIRRTFKLRGVYLIPRLSTVFRLKSCKQPYRPRKKRIGGNGLEIAKNGPGHRHTGAETTSRPHFQAESGHKYPSGYFFTQRPPVSW